ncbi:MAG: putative dehydrogenase [Planctomycetaceae bacterium]|nr:putative dehydrogenase [Planctomycetaceae bacterium]
MTTNSRREFLGTVGSGALVGALGGSLSWAVPTQAAPKSDRPKIKIGQIGVGHAHASKLSVYRASDDYEVVGIVEPDAKLRQQAETQAPFSGLKWMTQEQLLNESGLQAVLAETRVRDLLNTAETCVAAGKHVHLDKPAGESFPRYRGLLQLAEKSKLLVQMGYMFRYNPAVVLLRRCLAEGWLGEVFEVHAVMSKVVGPVQRKELAEYPGGIMFELGCHILDLVIGVLGKPNGVTPFPRHSSTLDDKLLDNMLAVLTYPRATATVKSSALEVDGGDRRHLVVCGSEGTFHIQPLDNPSARVTFSKPRGEFKKGYQDVKFPKYERYVDDAVDMARVIRGEKVCDFSYEHDLTVQTTLLQACGLQPT